MELSAQATERRVVDVHALEAFADLLFALDSDEPATAFYGKLCEATCRLAAMDRAVIFLYDEALRRVRAVGSHGIELTRFEEVHVTLEDAPPPDRGSKQWIKSNLAALGSAAVFSVYAAGYLRTRAAADAFPSAFPTSFLRRRLPEKTAAGTSTWTS